MVTLKEIHETFRKNLHIENTDMLDIALAVGLSKKRTGGLPLWVIIIHNSGGGKSEIINSFRGWLDHVFVLPKLTSKTLVNGFKNKKKYPDIAPMLDGKVVLIPEMAPILKLHPNEKGEVFAQLRDLYDGYAGTAAGTGVCKRYSDLHVTLIACATNVFDDQILIHQDLGTRELIFRGTEIADKEKLMDKCIENENLMKDIRKEHRALVKEFLESRAVKDLEISENILSVLKKKAKFITKMRAVGSFDSLGQLRGDVKAEEPTRIIAQLKKLYICLMNLEKDYSSEKALELIDGVAKSSCFPMRMKVYDYLLKNHIEDYSTSTLANTLRVGKGTIKRECAVLYNLGLVNYIAIPTGITDRFEDRWGINILNKFIKEEIKELPVT